MFNPEKLTHTTQMTLAQAIAKASELNNPVVEDWHLFWAMLNIDGVAKELLSNNTKQPQALTQEIDSRLSRLPTTDQTPEPRVAPQLANILNQAAKTTQKQGDEYMPQEVLLLALLEKSNNLGSLTKQFNININQIKQEINDMKQGNPVTSQSGDQNYKVLEKYTINLTQRAKDGKLDPVIGRDTEIRRIMQVLSRRTKNNPILIGDPGVGKTAIVEGLAQRIVAQDVPESLAQKQLLILDIASVLAGAKFRGEFEERLKAILKQITGEEDRYIVFIDELHTIVGAGSAEGAVDASNMLKPGLARGELHIIGATTINEYRKYIEKDAALERRFQPVPVGEPSIQDSIAILRGLKEKYEVHHGIGISDDAIVAAVELSTRYIPDRFLPDKAIDLLDEAASSIKIQSQSKPEQLDTLNRRITQLEIEAKALKSEKGKEAKQKRSSIQSELSNLKEQAKVLNSRWDKQKNQLEEISQIRGEIDSLKAKLEEAEREVKLDEAAKIKYGQIPELQKQLEKLEQAWSKIPPEEKLIKDVVAADDIASVVSRWTGIPVTKLLKSESDKLANLESQLSQRVIGQTEAITAVSNAIRRSRAGLAQEGKPIAVFLFLGPTGVGKTETAKTLAQTMFDDEKAMIRIDMSEYSERHSTARLIGAPPGYVGYDQGGQLTEAIRRKPYSVILLDEIEKAHDEIFNLFLQIFDDGRLTDGKGRTVDFKNSIIIMTSNLGSKIIQDYSDNTDKAQDQIWQLLKSKFPPEFINRLDQIILFESLTKDQLEKIVQLELNQVTRKLKDQNINLEVAPKALSQLAKQGYDPQFGARPLKRLIQSTVLDAIALELTSGHLKPNTTVTLEFSDQKFQLKTD